MFATALEPARRLRSFAPLVAALALLPCTAEAGDDSVYGTRGGQQLRELDHEIAMSFERGYATLTIQRTVHNGIERHDEAQFWLNLPWEGVATGLRSLGELDGRAKWFDAELLEAEAAAARYRELTGLGAYYPKDPALLSWRHQGHLALQVFPIAPDSDKTIEYTVELPASWHDGRWHLSLPAMGTAELAAELRIDPAEPLDQLFVDGELAARGHYEPLDRPIEIALAPRDPSRVALELASASTGPRALVHWRVTLAPEISTIPKHAQVVVILDLSKSAAAELEAQRELALAYLSHFEAEALAAEVAVLGFDREVHSLTPGFVSASEASETLAGASLRARNGSELGLALNAASDLLASSRARGPERVVVLGDFETALRVSPDAVNQASELGDALVHLVDTETGGAWLERADGHDWAELAARTGGVAWRASAPGSWSDASARAESIAVFEELGRPVRIDDVSLSIPGLAVEAGDELAVPSEPLDEGQGLSGLAVSTTPATKLALDGLLWNTPLRETARPSRALGERWSALAFGDDAIYPALSEDEMMVLALRGGAVSPVTSYLAIEPGVRPSTEGIEREEGWLGLGAGGSSGSAFGVGSGVFFGGGSSFDKRDWLEAELGEGWTRCGGAGLDAELSLETMTAELLDLELRAPTADASLRACMEQVAWSLDLPGLFEAREHWTIAV